VAIGLGEGGEFYRPMAVAIIGGTITSTLLTLLVVPTFYDSIEVKRDSMFAKYHAREARWNPALAFLATFFEAIFALLGLRAIYRVAKRLWVRVRGRGTPDAAAVPGTDD
jgi:hypothetical protein